MTIDVQHQPVQRRIDIELTGLTLTRNSLEIADESAFQRAGHALSAMDSFSQWWWADYLLYAEKFNLRTVLEAARCDLHRSTIYSYLDAGRYYFPKDRHPDLSFGHHASAMYILGVGSSVTEAKKWLSKAAAKSWTVGELREAMRADQRRREGDPGPMRGVIRITDFVKLSRYCSTTKPDDFPASEVDEIRQSTKPLFEFLCEIHQPKFGARRVS